MPSASWVGRSLVGGGVLVGKHVVEALDLAEHLAHLEGLGEAPGLVRFAVALGDPHGRVVAVGLGFVLGCLGIGDREDLVDAASYFGVGTCGHRCLLGR